MKRTLGQLIDRADPAWPLVTDWLSRSVNHIEILPADREKAERTLLGLQVTTRSPMGAVALESGGILVDYGWLRILGSGSEKLKGNLESWNGLDIGGDPVLAGQLIIAHDATGGFFALNGGRLSGKPGNVFYLAPDSLEWEDMEGGYSSFLQWATTDRLSAYYRAQRWPNWEADVRQLSGDDGWLFAPPLGERGQPVHLRSRTTVCMQELWTLHATRRLP